MVCIELARDHCTAMLMDTTGAYRLARKWMHDVQVDVARLESNCQAVVKASEYWNRVKRGAKVTKRPFVPMYDVTWRSPENLAKGGATAYVQLYLPTSRLLQLKCEDSKFMMRSPLLLTNVATLFPGSAPVYHASTNVIRIKARKMSPARIPVPMGRRGQ